jgi:hypothetical protein
MKPLGSRKSPSIRPEIESESDFSDGEVSDAPQSKSQDPKVDFEPEPSSDPIENLLEVDALLEFIHNIRKFLLGVWRQYSENPLSLRLLHC